VKKQKLTVVTATYRGYPLQVTAHAVTVYDPQGRKLAALTTFAAARAFVRGYRRHPRNATAVARTDLGSQNAGHGKEVQA
jgi:hypothetical protein